jgi:predicted kinase
MAMLTVLVGLPGSGKSTSIPEDFDGFVYSTDRFIEDAARHFNSTYNEMFKDNIGNATKVMDGMLAAAIAAGSDVIWDQTNMAAKKRRSILNRFPSHYHKVCICRVPPRDVLEWAELDKRILSREGKMIPHHIIESMADSYVEPTLDEGFDEVHRYDIYGNKLA